jgi:replicative superfamily II helicase
MKASEFKDRRFDFYEFNPVQGCAVPHTIRNVNMVVSSPTATGKTVIAECAFAHHLAKDFGRVAYISPLRSLTMQKYSEWKEDYQFSQYEIIMSTGDQSAKAEELEMGRILLLTSEAFDSKTRHRTHEKWLQEIVYLVVDEAHTIGDPGRGDHLETALMRFTQINPAANICFLSATMKNASDVASWVKSLNGKDTVKIVSRWRPNKLVLNIHEIDEQGWNGWQAQIETAVVLASERKAGEKVIIFVHSKRTGNEIRKKLKEAKISSAFHNAALRPHKRKQIEELFISSISGLDVIVATSTLAAGVNL